MKKNFLLIVCAIALVLGFSSCGGSTKESEDSQKEAKEEEVKEEVKEEEKELTRMIPASSISIKGGYNFFKIAGDAKLILMEHPAKKGWVVNAVIPISNTKSWSEIFKANFKNKSITDIFAYFNLYYIDTTGSEITGPRSSLTDLLTSEEIKTENISAQYQYVDGGCDLEYKLAKQRLYNINELRLEITVLD